jgi:hypothetical protein
MEIIESETEFESFISSSKDFDWVAVPVYCNGERSVYADSISVIYIYVINLDKEVTIVFNHTEGTNLSERLINNFPETNKIFVYGKKKFKHFLNRKNIIDINMVAYFCSNQTIDEDFETTAHVYFTQNFTNYSNLNTIIPIVKHIEKSQSIMYRFLDVYEKFKETDSFSKYDELILDSLYQIEKNGLHVDPDVFRSKFNVPNAIHDNLVYSEYNLYTTTARPSNRFGGINYAALNKDTGQRTPFTSRFNTDGFLVSFDYDAYHLRLIASLIDYNFPENVSAHEYLGKFYFDKTDLTRDEYTESKTISFRQLYGGIANEYLTIPFFRQAYEYTQLLWERFKADGVIETPLFSRKLHSEFFTDMNPSKLLNYLLQSYETERNMAVIYNILQRITSVKSKLILYTYDSLLCDFCKEDGSKFIKLVKSELEQGGKFPVKMEIGPNYSSMIPVKKQI